MENISLQAMAQQLREKKAQVVASVAKLELEVKLNVSGFCNYLHQRVDILVASGGSTLHPGSSFEQELLKAIAVYQGPLVNEINQAFNLQGIFPFADVISLNLPPFISSAINTEDSLQVIRQKLLQKKAQVEASLGGLSMEVRVNLIGFYEYLTQRFDILAVAGGSIQNPVVYLQEEIGKAFSLYLMPLSIALTEAFNLQAVFLRENGEHGQQQASIQAGTSSAGAAAISNQPENEANPGIVALLEEDDEYVDIKSEPNSDVEEQMADGAGDWRMEPEDYARADAQRLNNMFRHSRRPAPGRVNPNRRPSGPIKEEIVDDNRLALVLYQPPAGHQVYTGSIDEQEEHYLDDDDGSDNEDSIVDEESDQLEDQDVAMSDEEGSLADDDGDDSNEDEVMDDDDADVAENMSDIEDEDQNDNQEESSIDEDDDESDSTIIDETNYEENDEEEAQPALDVAGPSSMTLRRSTRNSARVTQASSAQQEQQATGRVSKRNTVSGRSTNGPRNGRNKETEPLSVITQKLKCTVPGCKKVVKSKNALNGHFLSVHKLKKYRCLVRRCHGKLSFTTQAQFSDHLDQVHGSRSRLACQCSKKFKSYNELYIHYYQYHELGLFACSKDGCTFKPTCTRAKVMHHLYNHRDARYVCPDEGCGKVFKKKGNLDKHRLIHSGERPFPCTDCNQSFTQKAHLARHLRAHRNDRCYRCTWPGCTHSATARSNVLRHIRTVHFQLPATKKQQAEEEIEDDRDPRAYLAMD